MSVVADSTERGVGGPSVSQLFGIGPAERSTRGEKFFLNTAMDQDPKLLPFAKLDLTQTVGGKAALAIGDGRGALALANAGDARGFLEFLDHPFAGRVGYPRSSVRFDGEPGLRTLPPLLGEHNAELLAERLGQSPEQIRALEEKQVIGTRPSFL